MDAIISVGYRVNSGKATQFRIWAIKVLKEYMIKGFVLDDERLKQGKTAFGKDYFGRTIVENITGLKSSGASKLIKLLLDSNVVIPVTGHGKGKFSICIAK